MNRDFRLLISEPSGYSAEALHIYDNLGDVQLGPFSHAELLKRIEDIHVIVIRLGHKIDGALIKKGRNLLVIVSPTTGLDHIDLGAAKRQNVEVISLKGETDFLRGIPATAELSWGLLLTATRKILAASQSASTGAWEREKFIGHDLKGKNLGIIGLGRIGKMVARYGLAFGMNVTAFDPFHENWVQGVQRSESLISLLEDSDAIMVHIPLNPETINLIGKAEFQAMKPGCVLINTSRGGIVDESELIQAMEGGKISAAALDVIQAEANREIFVSSPLVEYAKNHSNLILTPHIGGATVESMHATELFLAKKLQAFIQTRQDL
jgi:D-3-phosphoglycerate dehydrogenase / 2-oxoglutarate reductase